MPTMLKRLVAPFWAAILSFAITAVGQGLWGLLVTANLRLSPALPWAVPVMAVVLLLLWLFLAGAGRPGSTSGARRRLLSARPVELGALFWSLMAGGFSIAALAGFWIVLSQLVGMPPNLVPDASRYPSTTVLLILAMSCIAAPVTEEAAFRGYAQTILRDAYGPAAAVILSAVLFALAHFPQGLVPAKLLVYFLGGVAFGTIVRLTGSILASIPVHMAADLTFFTLVWPYDGGRRLVSDGGADGWFWIHCGQAVVFALLAIWAFRRLARAGERRAQEPAALGRRPAAFA